MNNSTNGQRDQRDGLISDAARDRKTAATLAEIRADFETARAAALAFLGTDRCAQLAYIEEHQAAETAVVS